MATLATKSPLDKRWIEVGYYYVISALEGDDFTKQLYDAVLDEALKDAGVDDMLDKAFDKSEGKDGGDEQTDDSNKGS